MPFSSSWEKPNPSAASVASRSASAASIVASVTEGVPPAMMSMMSFSASSRCSADDASSDRVASASSNVDSAPVVADASRATSFCASASSCV